ncbi:hypothetical protein [Bradyrhizobium liaoningense]|uniref:hypothetical protein n=1 Tax=Bradyrhizobium liaoningense TaxID=43992 RepID=UPI001BA635D9|nr:hypothetical protein [Bradyrhizobium liaoningense]MBR0822416.1 hypothetical protein [Bradyrhizobium liaoningense]
MLLFLAAKQTPPLAAAKDGVMRAQRARYPRQVELKVREVASNLKDEEKIEAAKKARHHEAVEEMRDLNRKQDQRRIEAYVKSASDPWIGQLAAIAWSAGDCATASVLGQNGATFCERDVLAALADDLVKLYPDEKATPALVVQDGSLVRFIWQRCIINSVKLPAWWPVGSRPFDPNRVQDTMAFWSGPARGGSIEALAAALELPVFQPLELMLALQEERWGQIAVDTENEVRRLRAVTFRLRGRAALDADIVGMGGEVAGKPDLAVVASGQSAVA